MIGIPARGLTESDSRAWILSRDGDYHCSHSQDCDKADTVETTLLEKDGQLDLTRNVTSVHT